jgi:hypothetical protein
MFFHTTNPVRFLKWPNFGKSVAARSSSRAPRNWRCSAWRVTGGGSADSLGQRGCREFQTAPGLRASRSCAAYVAEIPNFPSFPTQNEPTGFPMRPRRAAVVSARRQPPELTSRGTNQRVHAAREGLAARFRLFPSPFHAHSMHDSRPHRQTGQPASRCTGPMPRCQNIFAPEEFFECTQGAYS